MGSIIEAIRNLLRNRAEQAVEDFASLALAEANGATVKPDLALKVLETASRSLDDLQVEVGRIKRRRALADEIRRGADAEPKLAALEATISRADSELQRELRLARDRHAVAIAQAKAQMEPLQAQVDAARQAEVESASLVNPRLVEKLAELDAQRARLRGALATYSARGGQALAQVRSAEKTLELIASGEAAAPAAAYQGRLDEALAERDAAAARAAEIGREIVGVEAQIDSVRKQLSEVE